LFSKIKNGNFGEIHYINTDFGFIVENPIGRHIELNLGVGSPLDMCVYPLSLAYLILGKSEKVMASSLFFETGVGQQITMILRYLKAQAILQSSFISRTDMTATISGIKWRIVIDPDGTKPKAIQ
jgi:predicted dehydrogenase